MQLSFGTGSEGFYTPFFQFSDVQQWQSSWLWHRTGATAMSSNVFTPLPGPPPTNGAIWFFSGPPVAIPSDNGLYVLLPTNWPANPRLRVSMHIDVPSRGGALNFLIDDLRFSATGSAQDCAYRLCDAIQGVGRLHTGAPNVACGFGNLPAGPRLGVGTGGGIAGGHLNIFVEPGPPPPVITGVNPRDAREGDLITIVGNNFIGGPNELKDPHLYGLASLEQSALDGLGVLSTPLEILSVTSTQILARVGPVDPAAGAGPLVLSFGRGQQGSFTPSFRDLVPGSQVWTWNQTSISVTSTVPFAPRVSAPSAGTQWFFSGPPTNGALCVTLRGDWPRPSQVRVEARAHNTALLLGRNLRAVDVRFGGGGSTLDCAWRLCDVIRSAFRQQAGISVNCTSVPSPTGDGSVKVLLSLPEGRIDSGHLTVCVAPVPPLPAPVITSVSPTSVGVGDLVTILGRNLAGSATGDGTDAVSVAILNGDLAIPFDVVSASGTQIVAKLTAPPPPGARPGPILVSNGHSSGNGGGGSSEDPFISEWEFGYSVNEIPDVFTSGDANSTSLVDVSFMRSNLNIVVTSAFSDAPADGKLSVSLRGNWAGPSGLRVDARAFSADLGVGYELTAPSMILRTGGTALDYAVLISEVIRSAFLQLGGVSVNCQVSQVAGSPDAIITLSLPAGRITRGCLNVFVENPLAATSMVITDIQTRFGTNGALVRITGRGFGNNPDNLSLAVLRGSSSAMLWAISATDTEIVAQVGIGNPDENHRGPVSVARGFVRRLPPATHHPTAGTADWVWQNSLDPAVLANIDFVVLPGCPPYGTYLKQAMHSGPPQGGKLCLVVPPDLAFINRVFIDLQAHNTALGVARELHLIRCFGPYAPTDGKSKASLFCNYITDAFADQGIAVNCTVSALPNASAQLCVSLPEGGIDWGNLRICLHDYEVTFPDCGPAQIPKLDLSQFSSSSLQLSLPRSLTGYELEVTDDLFGNPPGFVRWVPLSLPLRATDIELQMSVPIGPGQPGLFFRLNKPAVDRGVAD